MSTHSIPFSIVLRKINLNYHKSAAMGYFLMTEERVRDSRGIRAIRDPPSTFFCICLLSST